MLNGHDDSIYPVESSQNPMFKALGTPEKDKRHIVYAGGHIDFMDRTEVIKDALDWLDRYLGPVKLRPYILPRLRHTFMEFRGRLPTLEDS